MNKAINNFNNTIVPALKQEQLSILDQNQIDEFLIKLDGTSNKSKLGANAILAASMICTKASALEKVKHFIIS